MADGGRIGLNEVELGIPVPRYWAALMSRTVAHGVAEKFCAFAHMATAQQALQVGMVDEVVPQAQVLQVLSSSIRHFCHFYQYYVVTCHIAALGSRIYSQHVALVCSVRRTSTRFPMYFPTLLLKLMQSQYFPLLQANVFLVIMYS
jgi:enoyl-CoA hydratase/carnithine racemase